MKQQKVIKEKGLLHLNGITSKQIMTLLEDKHSKDVVVPQCKNGETWGARDLLKLDAWVLRRSYSPLTTIGYEIKCSRQDFEQDQKWTGYLDLCHEFYFVCPAGLIRAADLPSRVGIMWASKDKVHTKRKAERVEPDTEKLNHLLIYVVMARAQIVASMYDLDKAEPTPRLQLIKEEIKRASERKELAYIVKGHIREIFEELNGKDRDFKFREDKIFRFEERLKQLGIHWDSKDSDWQNTMRVENEINMLGKLIDDLTLRRMGEVGRALIQTAETIKKYRTDST